MKQAQLYPGVPLERYRTSIIHFICKFLEEHIDKEAWKKKPPVSTGKAAMAARIVESLCQDRRIQSA